MNKFSVGTLVKLKDDLVINYVYGYLILYSHMYDAFKNKVARVTLVEKCGGSIHYSVEGMHYYWSEDMLEEVMLEKVKYKRTSIYA